MFNRSRQAAGQRTGGQFKAEQHTEGEVELGRGPIDPSRGPSEYPNRTSGEVTLYNDHRTGDILDARAALERHNGDVSLIDDAAYMSDFAEEHGLYSFSDTLITDPKVIASGEDNLDGSYLIELTEQSGPGGLVDEDQRFMVPTAVVVDKGDGTFETVVDSYGYFNTDSPSLNPGDYVYRDRETSRVVDEYLRENYGMDSGDAGTDEVAHFLMTTEFTGTPTATTLHSALADVNRRLINDEDTGALERGMIEALKKAGLEPTPTRTIEGDEDFFAIKDREEGWLIEIPGHSGPMELEYAIRRASQLPDEDRNTYMPVLMELKEMQDEERDQA